MDNREFEEFGSRIQNIIEEAVNSKNYQKLNQSISQTINRAVDDVLKNALGNTRRPENDKKNDRPYSTTGYGRPSYTGKEAPASGREEKETEVVLYRKNTGVQVKGVLMTVFGGILTGGMGIALLVLALIEIFGNPGAAVDVALGIMAVGTTSGAVLLTNGCINLGRLRRFKRYIRALNGHTYESFEKLSRSVGKSLKFVRKDIKRMIQKGWFLEGHVDEQKTCLITSDETYMQYVQTQKQLYMRQTQEKEREETRSSVSPEVQEVLDKGNEFLQKIRRSNDAIPGEEISRKISRMELIIEKIFQRAEEHPEVISDLKCLMDHYLPVTVKLLDAYEDMDQLPAEGENVRSSKKEIEDTLDTLNVAFEKLLDSVFKDTAWDVSSDISVLYTMLAQEGLTEDEFQKLKRESAKQREAVN